MCVVFCVFSGDFGRGFAQQLCVCVFRCGSVVGLRHGGCESMVGGVW